MTLRLWCSLALLTVSLGCSRSFVLEGDRGSDAGALATGGNQSSGGGGSGSGGRQVAGTTGTSGTSGGTGSGTPGGGGGSSGNAGSGGKGSSRTDGPFCGPPVWYCAPCADDATCGEAKFTVNPYGTVSSSCCGEEWTQRPLVEAEGTRTWEDAKKLCMSTTLLQGGWRLPTIAELYMLISRDKTGDQVPIDRSIFTGPASCTYWSSTEDVSDPERLAWEFTGTVDTPVLSSTKDTPNCVLCVR